MKHPATLFLIATIATLSCRSAAATTNAVSRTNALVAAFKSVKALPEDGTPLGANDRQANAKAFGVLDGFFDYHRLTVDPIAPHRDKFSATQLKQFTTEFRELIRLVAYPNAGAFLSEAELKVQAAGNNPKGKTSDVNMHAFLEKEDFETDVTYHWKSVGGTLRIVDVSFDGSSLIKDYRNQFGRIIAKDGVAGLLTKLHKRLEKEREKGVTAS